MNRLPQAWSKKSQNRRTGQNPRSFFWLLFASLGILFRFGVFDLSATTHYVVPGSAKPTAPFLTWDTAATNLQQALNVTLPNDEVVVTNGIFPAGLIVTNPVALRSSNGPMVTIIDGGGVLQGISLTTGASLTGFTITNCGGRSVAYGGGAFCVSPNTYLSNCVIIGNSASAGGGIYGGTLYNCTLANNSADYLGGGAWNCTLYDCALTNNSAQGSSYGGGVAESTLFNCTLSDNSAYEGGGTWYCTLYNCTVASNSASQGGGTDRSVLFNSVLNRNWALDGGGAYGGTLYNCTVVDNSADNYAGGAAAATLYNCVVYNNTAPQGANYDGSSALNHCCTIPLPASGVGNITLDPRLVNDADANMHLQSNSPCINAGNNAYVTTPTDREGNPRIISLTVDIGAYEFQGAGSMISYAWLQQYGLPTDSSTDEADPDNDGMTNWQEWIAGTNPTNSASALRLLPSTITPPGVLLRWDSDTNHAYAIERATSLNSPVVFTPLLTNVPGQPGTTTYFDTTAPVGPAVFYRISSDSTNGSAPVLLQPPQFIPAGLLVSWTSVTNRTYFLQRTTDLSSPFSLCASNVVGQAVTTTWTDTLMSGPGAFIYRVGINYP